MPSRDRSAVLAEMQSTGVVAVIRAPSADVLMDTSRALLAGGVSCLEITMSTPNAIGVIEQVSAAMPEACVGVGTVLDTETARLAILAGAQYVVTPTLKPAVIEMCRRYSVACITGGLTPTEILTAWEAGADVVKVFPSTAFGPGYFKDILGPLPQLKLTPTGGVTIETTPKFIAAGAVCVGAGSALVSKQLMVDGQWDEITANARAFTEAVKKGRA